LFKRHAKSEGQADEARPVWARSLTGDMYGAWLKRDGVPEEPALLKHCTSVDMEDDMLVNMLSAYGIPAVKQYPANGSFGKIVIGMSGEGTDVFVPFSMLEEAKLLIGGSHDE